MRIKPGSQGRLLISNSVQTGGVSEKGRLLGHWRFDGDAFSSVSGYPADIGTAEYTDGIIGQALNVVANNTATRVTFSPFSLNLTLYDETITFWMKADFPRSESLGGGFSNWMIHWGAYHNANSGGFGLQSGSIRYYIRGPEASGWTNTGLVSAGHSIYDEGGWIHYALVFEGNNVIRFYMNAQLVSTVNLNNSQTGYSHDEIAIGRNMLATIDDVRIYNRVLSETDIEELYEDPSIMTYSDIILSDNPVGYWRLVDATESIIAKDESPYQNDGEYIGNPISVPGIVVEDDNSAVDFDSQTFVRVPMSDINSMINSSNQWTAEAWVGRDDLKETESTTRSYVLGAWGGSLLFETYGNPRRFRVFTNTLESGTTSFGGPLLPNEYPWHIVAVFDKGNRYLFINGELQTSVLENLTSAWSRSFMDISNSGGSKFLGVIDAPALYATALSADRIKTHFDKGMGII